MCFHVFKAASKLDIMDRIVPHRVLIIVRGVTVKSLKEPVRVVFLDIKERCVQNVSV